MAITQALTQIAKAPIKTSPRPVRLRKPWVVFDMCFRGGTLRKPRAVPNAAMSLSLALKKSGIATPFFMNVPFLKEGKVNLPKDLATEGRPLFFALSLYDDIFEEIQAEVRAIKEAYPQAKIIIGGPSVNTCKDLKALASFFPDAIAFVKGDGELVITDLIRALSCQNGMDKNTIIKLKGIYVKEGVFEYQNERPNVITEEELNKQPGIIAYPSLVHDLKKAGGLYLHTSRGCKYRCVFCSHKYQLRPIYWSAERIVQELRRIRDMVKQGILPSQAFKVIFSDDDFFQDTERAITFLELVINDPSLRKSFKFTFQGTVRSFFRNKRRLNKKLLDLLTKIRIGYLNIGTDGFHPKALRFFKKGGGYTWEMVLKLMQALDKRNIPQMHYVILTYPSMTRQVLLETLENICEAYQNYSRTLMLDFHFYLTAYESNQLLPIAQELNPPRTLSSRNTARKHLPVDVPLRDNLLHKSLGKTLDIPFRIEDVTIDAKRNKALRKKWRQLERWERNLFKNKTPTFRDLLLTFNSFLQMWTLFRLEAIWMRINDQWKELSAD